ncbi:MAG TPA: DUF1957 domain-containing protein [bacterium]|nr:DUF1957 domain-containing protein [bacterium]
MKGYFMLLLHTHLPFVKGEGVWPFGEEWLYEVMYSSYIPLIKTLEELHDEGIKLNVTLSITPVLLSQLMMPECIDGFRSYMLRKMELISADRDYFKHTGEIDLYNLTFYYRDILEERLRYFEELGGNIVNKISELAKNGAIELITSSATHAYLPLLKNEKSIKLQLKVGREEHISNTGIIPYGMWLPECAYRPGLEKFMSEVGYNFSFFEESAISGGKVFSPYGGDKGNLTLSKNHSVFRPYYIKDSNVSAFGRAGDLSGQIWSKDMGYPGEAFYREFHKRKEGSGLQYWRVTGPDVDLGVKEPYIPDLALKKTKEHAGHFLWRLERTVESLDIPNSVIVTPFDTELFGHWWWEGIDFLREFFIRIDSSPIIETITPSRYLASFPPTESIEIPESSWGVGGKHDVWYNEDTRWMWEKIYEIENKLDRVLSGKEFSGWQERIADQLIREFLLLTSSDWEFLIYTKSAGDYGERRFNGHLTLVKLLIDLLNKPELSNEDKKFIVDLERRHSVFSKRKLWSFWR